MMPPANASGQPVNLADAFDVPVIVRNSSPLQPERRPSRGRIDKAWSPWPNIRDVVPPGDYLVSTTWREVVDAAMTYGRDPYAWLVAVPGLAAAEIIARRFPLSAYLCRTRNGIRLSGSTGFRLEPNVVYQEGTEKTARAMFAYRIGMTMAEWVCRGLMGLGPTIHAEALPLLPGRGPRWSQKNSQPDLVGLHWKEPRTWLIEAKGARRTGKPELAKGASQLSVSGLMAGPHLRVLCGTSIEHRVFVTVDIEAAGRKRESSVLANSRRLPDEDDTELVALARSRMLTYYVLRSLPRSLLSVRPIGPAVADLGAFLGQVTDLVVPLERDDSTRRERVVARDRSAYARRPPSERWDMLTGKVPGTDLTLGMSRRLFAACHSLAAEQDRLLLEAQADFPDLWESAPEVVIEDMAEERIRERRAWFAEREAGERERLFGTTRRAYERGRESSWQELLDIEPQLDVEPQANQLESATLDSYLAIDAETVSVAAE
ncbi:hypothetical protein [Actinomadura mexicana]|uniref:Uncharacterized protein n=1 Tax=Actinomadura mexicana TaxID=134959 RepID=A0A239CLX1_9ACTN|nr:hypothetical protein [Actinomadura mexicana]SNS21145.1 hypothetical protein SAMN06265355_1132 [Actinomadura mexicana]